ncbi:hypothetical protein RKD24_004346 [Streptomyces calvus]
MRAARVRDLLAAVALGEHHLGAARRLELLHVGVHAPGGRRTEGTRRVPLGRLRGPGVVHRVVLQVLRHLLAGVQPLLDLGVRDVAGHDQRTGQRQPGLHRVLGELREDVVHRLVQVDLHDVTVGVELLVRRLRQEPRRVRLQLLQEHALGGDLRDGLAVGGAGHGDGDRAGRAVPRQPDHAHVVAEVLAAELRADADLLRQLEDLLLQLLVPEAVAERRALGGDLVQVVRGGVLGGLQRVLGRRTADDDRQVVRRAGGRAQRTDLLLQELHHGGLVQDRLGLLVEERLVGRAAALGHEQELVGAAVGRVQLDLRREVGAGVLLLPHGQRRHLRVAQVQVLVRVVDAPGQGLLVAALGQHVLAALAHHDRRAGVLAHREHARRRDVRVLQQVQRDELVVGRRLGVVDDAAQLGEVGRAQVVLDVVDRLLGELAQRLRLHLEEGPAVGLEGGNTLGGHQPVGGGVLSHGEQIGVLELRHLAHSSLDGRPPASVGGR